MENRMDGILRYLEEFNMVTATIRLVLATVLGGIVGMERAAQRRTAGLRTFALVSLGSALAMITNQYLIIQSGVGGDPSRMAAQVIGGVGFLGVGTIIVTGKNHVTGLTTAAGLWTTSMMGLCIGSGFIGGSVISFILIMISIRLLQYVSRYQEEFNRYFDVHLEIDKVIGYNELMNYLEMQPYVILQVKKKVQRNYPDADMVLMLKLDLRKKYCHKDILKDLRQVKGVHYIEEIW